MTYRPPLSGDNEGYPSTPSADAGDVSPSGRFGNKHRRTNRRAPSQLTLDQATWTRLQERVLYAPHGQVKQRRRELARHVADMLRRGA